MKIFQFFFPTLIILFFSTFTFPQETKSQNAPKSKEQVELEKKTFELLSEVKDEVASLKLAENRAFVFSLVGYYFWEKDEKLARRLFMNAAGELIQAQNNPKKRNEFSSGSGRNYWSEYVHRVLRGQIIYKIQAKDPKLALEILTMTRPAELAVNLEYYAQAAAKSGGKPDLSTFKSEEREKLNNAVEELRTEQRIKKEIDKDDPQKLEENIRESVSQGGDIHEILNDLEKLNKKDHTAAQKMLSEILRKLSDPGFKTYWKSYAAYLLYNKFLAAKNKPKSRNSNDKTEELEIDEKSFKAIANQEFDYLLTQDPSKDDFAFVEKILYLRRILPERFNEIKGKYEKAKATQVREWAEDVETTERLGSDPTLNQIIENSSKLSADSRVQYYKKSIGKLSETESREKIAQMLDKIPEVEDKQQALDHLSSIFAEKNAATENSSEAVSSVLQIKSAKERFSKLISLAIFYHQKGTEENRKIAGDLMEEAGKIIKQTPETRAEHKQFLEFVSGYSTINPQKAFDLILPLIGKSNDLIDAFVLIGSYDDMSYPYYSENEIVFTAQDGYSSYSATYREIAKNLAMKDFDQAKNLIKNFRREDVRVMAKLIFIESVLTK